MPKTKEEQEAIIINNIPHCPKCKAELGNIKSHDLVIINGRKYTKFVKFCSQRKCNGEGVYYIAPSLQDSTRLVFNGLVQEEIIKDNKDFKGDEN
ncbi:MAG: hypothetical protein ACLTDM_11180 [Clostridium butyricum]